MRKVKMWYHMVFNTRSKFYVVYWDGKRTVSMRYREACGYASLFSGVVHFSG